MAKATLFNSVQMTKPNKNVFDLSHDVKLSCNMGDLVPIMVMDCVPGDHITIGCESLVRFAPMVFPVMHRFNVTCHYFFVPNRIMWAGWEAWITSDPNDVTGVFPFIDFDDTVNPSIIGGLADYLGIPPAGPADYVAEERVSALPFAAYQLIYNEFYRDQNLITNIFGQTSPAPPLADGDNSFSAEYMVLRKRAWEHDYFTSCLPFAQKGAQVTIPSTTLDDVEVFASSPSATSKTWITSDFPGPVAGNAIADVQTPVGATIPTDHLFAATSGLATNAASINDLRRAFRLQEFLEKNARGGTRYIEHILMHFGVRSSDKRLNRPEYITGTKSPIVISEVLNTTGEDGGLPQGNMAGHGVGVTSGRYGKYFVEEHGYIIGIMSVMPMTAYQQGIERHFKKMTDPTQYFYPSFAHIGEQQVLNHEIYAYLAQGTDPTEQDGGFGYIPRYAEYKYLSNRVAGDFRDEFLDFHAGRVFATQPALNQAFIEMDHTATDRIFAVTSPDIQKLYVHHLNKIKAVRPMPKFGTPSF